MSETPAVAAVPVAADPWTAGIKLAQAVLEFVGDEIAMADANKFKKLQLDLQDELRKPREEQDDGKVMALREQIPVYYAAALMRLETYKTKQK